MKKVRKREPTTTPSPRPADHSKSLRAQRRGLDFPRVDMTLSALVTGKSGERSHAKLLNISLGGVGLGLDLKNSRRVFPDGKIRPGTPLRVGFELPQEANAALAVVAVCRILWTRQIGKDLFYLGAEFTDFEKDGKNRVERFILDCMRFDWP